MTRLLTLALAATLCAQSAEGQQRIERLVRRLDHVKITERRAAIKALRKIGAAARTALERRVDDARVSAKQAPQIARQILALGDRRWRRRDAASRALARIGRPAISALKRAAASQNLEVASRARCLLETMPDRSGRTGRVEAVFLLAELGTLDSVGALMAALRSSSVELVSAADLALRGVLGHGPDLPVMALFEKPESIPALWKPFLARTPPPLAAVRRPSKHVGTYRIQEQLDIEGTQLNNGHQQWRGRLRTQSAYRVTLGPDGALMGTFETHRIERWRGGKRDANPSRFDWDGQGFATNKSGQILIKGKANFDLKPLWPGIVAVLNGPQPAVGLRRVIGAKELSLFGAAMPSLSGISSGWLRTVGRIGGVDRYTMIAICSIGATRAYFVLHLRVAHRTGLLSSYRWRLLSLGASGSHEAGAGGGKLLQVVKRPVK